MLCGSGTLESFRHLFSFRIFYGSLDFMVVCRVSWRRVLFSCLVLHVCDHISITINVSLCLKCSCTKYRLAPGR